MIISRTPFRVSFFGGGTDYRGWFQEHGGSVLTSSINYYCYLTCRFLPPFFEHRSRVVWSQVEKVQDHSEIAHPVVKAILRHLNIDRGVEIFHHGDLPARSGLGSSSAFTVGLLHALHALTGKLISKRELAEQAIMVEQVLLKEHVGVQDQIETSFGGLNRIDIRTDGSFEVRPVVLPAERLDQLQDHLALFYTGISRHASEIAAEHVAAIPKSSQQLHGMRALVDQAEGILAGGALSEFGKILHESWMMKKSISARIAPTLVDEMYDRGRKAGAIGGKLLGAGGGGFLLFLVAPEQKQKLIDAMAPALHVPFVFDRSGTQIIFYEPDELNGRASATSS
ncbi:MAG: kinase [Alphaproteobacteria bacterium]|nr:kinase [Alphaproteobacteria bacterium]